MLKHYYKLVQIFESIINILIVCVLNPIYLFRKISLPRRRNDIIQILGNGPSLNEDISRIVAKRKNTSLMAVNGFADTDLFVKLKPDYYTIVDPTVFLPSTNERIIKFQESTIKALIDKTKWEMNFLVPFSAKKSYFINKLEANNPFIKITYLKNIQIIGGSQRLNNFFFTHNLANPFYMTVLINAIFTSLKMGFNKIIVWGADHSWHENYELGKDNYINRMDKHFSDKNDTGNLIVLKKPDGSPVTVHEEFLNISSVLKVYHSLESFSRKINLKIINLSSKTWIDAFVRSDN
jgi:hypothetical protein